MKEKLDSFLFKYGGYIIYLVFLTGLFLNGYMGIFYFKNGPLWLGIWALLSIFILPKSVLGLVLLFGRRSLLYTNLPGLIRGLLPRTIQGYRDISLSVVFGSPEWKRLIKETIWLAVGLLPLIVFLFFR